MRLPWADCSRRVRLIGRADCGFAPFVVAELGGFFVDIEGDGDDRIELAPLVWMPGGTGRLILDATEGGWMAVTTGAIFAGWGGYRSATGQRWRREAILPLSNDAQSCVTEQSLNEIFGSSIVMGFATGVVEWMMRVDKSGDVDVEQGNLYRIRGRSCVECISGRGPKR